MKPKIAILHINTSTRSSYVTPGYVNHIDALTGDMDGYVAIWGTSQRRDSYNTWFDREKPPDMALDFMPRPIMYEHGMDGQVGDEIIGSVNEIGFDDVGITFKGTLFKSCLHYVRIAGELISKKLKTSSSSGEHTAVWDDFGRFVRWPLLELSLTANPAEDLMPAVSVRSMPMIGLKTSVNTGTREERDALSPVVAQSERLIQGDIRNMDLQALLQQMAQGQEVPLDQLIAALVQEYGADNVQQILQQMQQPAAADGGAGTGSTTNSVEGRADGAEAGNLGNGAQAGQIATPIATPNGLVTSQNPAILQLLTALGTQRSKQLQSQQRQQQGAPPAQGHNVVTTRSAPQQQSSGGQRGSSPNITVTSRYQHLNAGDMALGYMLLASRAKVPQNMRSNYDFVSEDYLRAMSYKTAQLIKKDDPQASDYAVRSKFPFRSPDEVMQSAPSAAIRTGEITDGSAGQGDEWIYDLQGTTLWYNIRNEALVYKAMMAKGMDEAEIPQGYDNEKIPLEGTDPSFYVAAGASDVDASSGMPTPTFNTSKFSTGQKSVTVAKLSAAMDFRRELEEDSIINIVQEANRKLRVRSTEIIDDILMNGDTALGANTNINLIDSTPAAAPAQPYYTLLNGLLKLALVTNTANKRDAGAAFDETDFLETFKLLPPANRQNRDKLLYILDSDTAVAASNIPTLKTRDVFTAATLEEGTLTKIWRIAVLETGFMGLANANGKISNTPGNNTLGRILLVRPDQWASRWKRRLQLDVTYYPYQDVTQVVAHMRWGVAFRDNEASAVSYNVNVALT